MNQGKSVRPSVDVIVPTYGPGEKFHILMRMLRRQTYPIHKIIIMNTDWCRSWNPMYNPARREKKRLWHNRPEGQGRRGLHAAKKSAAV